MSLEPELKIKSVDIETMIVTQTRNVKATTIVPGSSPFSAPLAANIHAKDSSNSKLPLALNPPLTPDKFADQAMHRPSTSPHPQTCT